MDGWVDIDMQFTSDHLHLAVKKASLETLGAKFNCICAQLKHVCYRKLYQFINIL